MLTITEDYKTNKYGSSFPQTIKTTDEESSEYMVLVPVEFTVVKMGHHLLDEGVVHFTIRNRQLTNQRHTC